MSKFCAFLLLATTLLLTGCTAQQGLATKQLFGLALLGMLAPDVVFYTPVPAVTTCHTTANTYSARTTCTTY